MPRTFDLFDTDTWTTWHKTKAFGLLAGTGLVAFASMRYKISRPNEYLIRTGLGVQDIGVIKNGFHGPFNA